MVAYNVIVYRFHYCARFTVYERYRNGVTREYVNRCEYVFVSFRVWEDWADYVDSHCMKRYALGH